MLCRLDGVRRLVAARRSQAIAPSAGHPGSLPIPDSPVVEMESTSAESERPESRTLCLDIEDPIRQAEQAVFSHVESFGCSIDLDLKLKVLDWKTRVVELERRSHTEEVDSYAVRKLLTEMVQRAREDVISHITQNRYACTDIELMVKVLELERRVVEKNKMLEGTVP